MSGKAPGSGTKGPPVAKAAINDILAVNRTVELMPISSLPGTPDHYAPTDPDVRRKMLRFVDDSQRSELVEGLREIVKVGWTQLKLDLGDVPDAAEADALADRIVAVADILNALQPLVNCYNELEMIALSDGVLFLDTIWNEYEHFVVKKPQIAARYKKLVTFYQQKSAKIVEGKTRAKAEQEATAAAVAKAKSPEK